MGNALFKNAIQRVPQKVPPVWFMRQAGRYHKHYQGLRSKHEFMELCKVPELAAEVAMGPIRDFDFDVAILFSDLLFPLEAMGMGLKYAPGPILDKKLTLNDLPQLKGTSDALEMLQFQKVAMQLTREALPANKSLIGFVGGPWTLFSYAAGGGHDGSLIIPKSDFSFFLKFSELLLPLLKENIRLQLEGGAEVVMIFDTAAGELTPHLYNQYLADGLNSLADTYPGKLGYYSKTTHFAHIEKKIFTNKNWAGFGVDHRFQIEQVLTNSVIAKRSTGFIQGNFDQALLFSAPEVFAQRFKDWLRPIKDLSLEERRGWVCGLGHGVLPATPERNVKSFVNMIREELS